MRRKCQSRKKEGRMQGANEGGKKRREEGGYEKGRGRT